jgi:hypothetical protein
MPKYFKNIKSEAQAKAKYRELAIKHHPDKGGSEAKFQEIKQEYEDILIYFRVGKELAIPGTRQKEKPELKKEYAEDLKNKASEIASTATKAGIDYLLDKLFSIK